MKVYFFILLFNISKCWDLSSLHINSDYYVSSVAVHRGRGFLALPRTICSNNETTPTLVEVQWNGDILTHFSNNRPKIILSQDWNNCEDLQNAISLEMEPVKPKLWILDKGNNACLPKILSYSLVFNTIVENTELTNVDGQNLNGFVIDPVVDDSFGYRAYIGRTEENMLLVFSLRTLIWWKIRLSEPSIFSIPVRADFLTISRDMSELFLTGKHALDVFSVKLDSIREVEIPLAVEAEAILKVVNVTHRGQELNEGTGIISDWGSGLLYFLIRDYAIVRWDTMFPLQAEYHNVVIQSYELLPYISSFFTDSQDSIWAVVNPTRPDECIKRTEHIPNLKTRTVRIVKYNKFTNELEFEQQSINNFDEGSEETQSQTSSDLGEELHDKTVSGNVIKTDGRLDKKEEEEKEEVSEKVNIMTKEDKKLTRKSKKDKIEVNAQPKEHIGPYEKSKEDEEIPRSTEKDHIEFSKKSERMNINEQNIESKKDSNSQKPKAVKELPTEKYIDKIKPTGDKAKGNRLDNMEPDETPQIYRYVVSSESGDKQEQIEAGRSTFEKQGQQTEENKGLITGGDKKLAKKLHKDNTKLKAESKEQIEAGENIKEETETHKSYKENMKLNKKSEGENINLGNIELESAKKSKKVLKKFETEKHTKSRKNTTESGEILQLKKTDTSQSMKEDFHDDNKSEDYTETKGETSEKQAQQYEEDNELSEKVGLFTEKDKERGIYAESHTESKNKKSKIENKLKNKTQIKSRKKIKDDKIKVNKEEIQQLYPISVESSDAKEDDIESKRDRSEKALQQTKENKKLLQEVDQFTRGDKKLVKESDKEEIKVKTTAKNHIKPNEKSKKEHTNIGGDMELNAEKDKKEKTETNRVEIIESDQIPPLEKTDTDQYVDSAESNNEEEVLDNETGSQDESDREISEEGQQSKEDKKVSKKIDLLAVGDKKLAKNSDKDQPKVNANTKNNINSNNRKKPNKKLENEIRTHKNTATDIEVNRKSDRENLQAETKKKGKSETIKSELEKTDTVEYLAVTDSNNEQEVLDNEIESKNYIATDREIGNKERQQTKKDKILEVGNKNLAIKSKIDQIKGNSNTKNDIKPNNINNNKKPTTIVDNELETHKNTKKDTELNRKSGKVPAEKSGEDKIETNRVEVRESAETPQLEKADTDGYVDLTETNEEEVFDNQIRGTYKKETPDTEEDENVSKEIDLLAEGRKKSAKKSKKDQVKVNTKKKNHIKPNKKIETKAKAHTNPERKLKIKSERVYSDIEKMKEDGEEKRVENIESEKIPISKKTDSETWEEKIGNTRLDNTSKKMDNKEYKINELKNLDSKETSESQNIDTDEYISSVKTLEKEKLGSIDYLGSDETANKDKADTTENEDKSDSDEYIESDETSDNNKANLLEHKESNEIKGNSNTKNNIKPNSTKNNKKPKMTVDNELEIHKNTKKETGKSGTNRVEVTKSAEMQQLEKADIDGYVDLAESNEEDVFDNKIRGTDKKEAQDTEEDENVSKGRKKSAKISKKDQVKVNIKKKNYIKSNKKIEKKPKEHTNTERNLKVKSQRGYNAAEKMKEDGEEKRVENIESEKIPTSKKTDSETWEEKIGNTGLDNTLKKEKIDNKEYKINELKNLDSKETSELQNIDTDEYISSAKTLEKEKSGTIDYLANKAKVDATENEESNKSDTDEYIESDETSDNNKDDLLEHKESNDISEKEQRETEATGIKCKGESDPVSNKEKMRNLKSQFTSEESIEPNLLKQIISELERMMPLHPKKVKKGPNKMVQCRHAKFGKRCRQAINAKPVAKGLERRPRRKHKKSQ